MNSIVITGNIGQDPVVKHTQNGNVHATFSIATSKYYVDEKTGERKQITKWVPVSVWGRAAEDVEKHVKKGQYLFAHGEYTARSYEKNGHKKYYTELAADIVGPVYGYLTPKASQGDTAQQSQQGTGSGFNQFGTPEPDPNAPQPYDNDDLPF